MEKLKTAPIPELLEILQEAFALFHDFTKNNLKVEDEIKHKTIDSLKNLWERVLQNNETLTSAKFQEIILDLTKTIFKSDYEREVFFDDIVFIVFSNPNPKVTIRNIGIGHFVNQFCDDNYSAYIANLDVLLTSPLNNSKKDPHWSIENDPLSMLTHDFGHHINQIAVTPINRKNIKNICKIHKKYSSINGKDNESKIVMNGLFLLTHEFPFVFGSPIKSIKEAVEEIKSYDIKAIPTSKTTKRLIKHYKEEHRDHERMLRDVSDLTGPLLPVIEYDSNNHLKRPFPFAVDPEDKNKLIIVTPETANRDLIYLTDQKTIPQNFTNVKEASEKRIDLMHTALTEGYKRFWNYFLQLVEPDLKWEM